LLLVALEAARLMAVVVVLVGIGLLGMVKLLVVVLALKQALLLYLKSLILSQ
jgi:hypothetical protein